MRNQNVIYLKVIDIITGTLLILGGLNLGLMGFLGFNPIDAVFGSMSIGSRIAYGLIGISALYEASMVKFIWRRWECSGFSRGSGHPATS